MKNLCHPKFPPGNDDEHQKNPGLPLSIRQPWNMIESCNDKTMKA